MDNGSIEFMLAIRAKLRALSVQMNEHPFADVLLHDGKYISRSQARAIERGLWPLAFPQAARSVAA